MAAGDQRDRENMADAIGDSLALMIVEANRKMGEVAVTEDLGMGILNVYRDSITPENYQYTLTVSITE